jgi:ribosome-associated protein
MGRCCLATGYRRTETTGKLEKLANKITDDGFLLVKSQTERSQLGNKQEVIRKMNQLLSVALTNRKYAALPNPVKPQRKNGSKAKKETLLTRTSAKK